MKKEIIVTIISLVGITAIGTGCVPTALIARESDNVTYAVVPATETNSDNIVIPEPTQETTANLTDVLTHVTIPKLTANSNNLSLRAQGIWALTDQEIADCVAIALQYPRVAEVVKNTHNYGVGFQWITLSGTGYQTLPYDVIEKRLDTNLIVVQGTTIKPIGAQLEGRIFYPGVSFRTSSYVYLVAVDLSARKIVYTTGGPTQKGPTTPAMPPPTSK
ncbi:MAG: hypothetical protein PHR56_03535 [Dehalococcoidales bacterium]|nr:hypothetical protein [Dehalococcoidales bacterium]